MFSQRHFSFRLRTALLGMTTVAVLLGHQSYQWQLQASALTQLQTLGAQVHDQHSHTAFWRSRLGPDNAVLAAKVTEIGFMGSDVGDRDLDHLVRCAQLLPALTRIDFFGTCLTFQGENALKSRLPHIEIHRADPMFDSIPVHGIVR